MAWFVNIVKKINYYAFILSTVLLFIMGMLVSYDVIMRYFFNQPTAWVNEISGYMLVIIAFMAAGHTLKEGGHINVDFIENNASPKIKYIAFLVSHFVMLCFMFVISWKGLQMTMMSFELNWVSATILETPLYIPQLFIPLGGILFSLQIIAQVIEKTKIFKEESR